MSKTENEPGESIAFGEELKSLDTDLLEVGNYLTIKTKSSSRYIFKVISKNNEGIKIKCVAGSEELLREEGNLINSDLLLEGKLFFGENLADKASISELRGIVVTQNAPDLSAKPIEYGKKLDSVETASLKVGDLVVIEVKSKSAPIYKFEVIAINTIVYSSDIQYIRLIVWIHEGKKKHIGRCIELTSSFLQKDCYLKGENFKLKRRIQEILVTKGLAEVARNETHSAVADTVEEEVPAIQEPIIITNLSKTQQAILLNLGLNADEGITKSDLEKAWDDFERKLGDPKEIEELINVFQDFLLKLPPSNIDLSILKRQVSVTLDGILRML